METLYKIESFVIDMLHFVWSYAEPHVMEIVIFLIVATFFFGFFGSSR
ncbi:hypothetical protein NC796_09075 [Aliifodinibius sp. S!AR15-10]|nr:hypothetical protein [Aliifodinibius sp. S!AR15-10]MDR8391287.1 hypothetical protein [Aliifodinibius sp. S!AR15-10]